MFGNDIVYAGEGDDTVYGGIGDDLIFGDEGDDSLYGQAGEDIIYGGPGEDFINSGEGWDTIFGGDGCDSIYTYGGGDVVWLGDCGPVDGGKIVVGDQSVTITGTGEDPENFTVIMDFWLESALPWNEICIDRDYGNDNPSAGGCSITDNTNFCINAA